VRINVRVGGSRTLAQIPLVVSTVAKRARAAVFLGHVRTGAHGRPASVQPSVTHS
jgi:hypothetical protein